MIAVESYQVRVKPAKKHKAKPLYIGDRPETPLLEAIPHRIEISILRRLWS
jgi:hypothetical protein